MSDINLPKQIVDRIEARWSARHAQTERRGDTIDRRLEQLRAHRNNVRRYRRLLRTQLTDLERKFIERRLAEEMSAMDALVVDLPPLIVQEGSPLRETRSEGANL